MRELRENTDTIWIKIPFYKSGEIQSNGKCHFNNKRVVLKK